MEREALSQQKKKTKKKEEEEEEGTDGMEKAEWLWGRIGRKKMTAKAPTSNVQIGMVRRRRARGGVVLGCGVDV